MKSLGNGREVGSFLHMHRVSGYTLIEGNSKSGSAYLARFRRIKVLRLNNLLQLIFAIVIFECLNNFKKTFDFLLHCITFVKLCYGYNTNKKYIG